MLDKLLANIPESFWQKVDILTSTCPTCAFVRGFVLGGLIVGALAWLM